jgi:signal transduction histidine kinase
MAAQDSREVLALRSLHELITKVNAVHDLDALLQTAVQGVVDVLGFQMASIDVLDAHGYLEIRAVAGDQSAQDELLGRRMPRAHTDREFSLSDEWGLLRFLPHERLPEDLVTTWVPDIEILDVPDAWHPLDTLSALLQGPDGEFLGVLGVDMPTDGRRPGALQRQILEMYAVQAGLAIHHAQQRERLSERIRLASTVRTIVEAAAGVLDVERILDRAVDPLVIGFGCTRMLIRAFDDQGGAPAPGHSTGFPEEVSSKAPAELLELADLGARRAWDLQRTVVAGELGDTSAGVWDDDQRRRILGRIHDLGGSSMLAAPLGSGPECLGYFAMLRSGHGREWTEAERDAAFEVGQEIGRALMHARLYQRERELNEELQELDAYKGELIATITHELKTPLTSIRGHAELLEDSAAPQASVRAIARNAERLHVLAEDLLLLAKVKDPNRPLIPAPVDLPAITSEVCDLFAMDAGRQGVAIVADLDPDVRAWGDRHELERVLVNLVGNAVKYSPAGGLVTLSVSAADGTAILTCADTGLGIAEDDLRDLFDEFNRSTNPAAQALPGTGLGLAIVRRILDRHGGTIAVQSELGSGSTFRIAIPSAPVL